MTICWAAVKKKKKVSQPLFTTEWKNEKFNSIIKKSIISQYAFHSIVWFKADPMCSFLNNQVVDLNVTERHIVCLVEHMDTLCRVIYMSPGRHKIGSAEERCSVCARVCAAWVNTFTLSQLFSFASKCSWLPSWLHEGDRLKSKFAKTVSYMARCGCSQ